MVDRVSFWAWQNGQWTLIELEQGASVEFTSGGKHEEGYSREYQTFSLEGDVVTSVWACFSRDCDGQGEHHSENYCPVDRLDAECRGDEEMGIRWVPQWREASSSCRDYEAERAGY